MNDKKAIRCPACKHSHCVPLYRDDFGVPRSGELFSIHCRNCGHVIDKAEIERQASPTRQKQTRRERGKNKGRTR